MSGQTQPPPPDVMTAAAAYLRRGWAPIPVRFKDKDPGRKDWQKLRMSAGDLPQYFPGQHHNVGVLLGEPSGGLIDIDLDHPLAVAKAAEFLLPTPAVFGRDGKRRSHWVYCVEGRIEPQKFASKAHGVIVEIRSTGQQSVFPPSVHPSGETIAWDDPESLPARIDAEALIKHVTRLHHAVLNELGEPVPETCAHVIPFRTAASRPDRVLERAAKYLAKLPPAVSGQGGHNATFHAACRLVVDFDIAPEDAYPVLADWNQSHCQPPWTESELWHKLNDAQNQAGERGRLLRNNQPQGAVSVSAVPPRPVIAVTGAQLPSLDAGNENLPEMAKLCWKAFEAANDPPYLFRSGGEPVRLERDEKGDPFLNPLTEDRLKNELARAAHWKKRSGRSDPPVYVDASPSRELVKDLLASTEIPFPILARIVGSPVFAPDGSLQTTPGYHSASQTYYAPATGFRIPAVSTRPSDGEIEHARHLICDEMLGDFPFVGEAEIAHAIALLLLPFARDLIPGATPLHLVEKPTPGTGATLLVDVLAMVSTGRSVETMTEARNEEEWRKRITAVLRLAPQFVLIDNLSARLDSAAFSSAITSPTWLDRILVSSSMARCSVRCCWAATGNNPRVSEEVRRRVVRIRLDARSERPHQRTEFRHANLKQWVAINRSRLVWAALTLIQGWVAKGRPPGAKTLGMFEEWAQVLGGILEVSGLNGFLGNLEDFYAANDAGGNEWDVFLEAWWLKHGSADVVAGDLFPLAVEAGLPIGDEAGNGPRVRLGYQIRDRLDRVFVVTDSSPETHPLRVCVRRNGQRSRNTLWKLEIVEP